MTKTAKQLEEEAYNEHWPFSQGMGETEDREGYFFTPDQLKAYRTRLLQEQREICAKYAEVIYEPVIPGGGRTAEYIPEVDKGSIINAPEPE